MDKLVMYLNRELAECKRELARMRPVVEAADRMVTARAQEDVKAYRKALGDLVEAIHVKRHGGE